MCSTECKTNFPQGTINYIFPWHDGCQKLPLTLKDFETIQVIDAYFYIYVVKLSKNKQTDLLNVNFYRDRARM